MRGVLCGHVTVELHPDTAGTGGSWEGGRINADTLLAYDTDAVQLVCTLLRHRSGNTVLFDVGANTGSFALLGTALPGLVVHAFEPVAYASDILTRNVALNGLSERVHVNMMGLSDTGGAGLMQVPTDRKELGLAVMDGTPRRYQRYVPQMVERVTLDEYCDQRSINRIDVLKIDTEGHELKVLLGGQVAIQRFRPIMLVEYNAMNTAQHGYKPDAIRTLVESWGYTVEMFGEQDILCTPRL